MSARAPNPAYVGRFAPSPTGDLHFGSLVAAVASFLQARRNNGAWRVRIEDIDPPREVAGSAERILRDLASLGLEPDGPVLHQSERHAAYDAAIARLLEEGTAYWCGCSRSELPGNGRYPGTCRNGLPPGKEARAVRVRVPDSPVAFEDRVQGSIRLDLAATGGDFVIRRADGLPAYQLAVTVDDAWQGVTEVVRGADLLESTARQIHLQSCLNLETPAYAHVPIALAPDGTKLGKRLGSDPVRNRDPATILSLALRFLGHRPPRGSLQETWEWAFSHWSLQRVPREPGPAPLEAPDPSPRTRVCPGGGL